MFMIPSALTARPVALSYTRRERRFLYGFLKGGRNKTEIRNAIARLHLPTQKKKVCSRQIQLR